ncbi:MAG: sugar transferase [Chloroflexi bacterium]|nr:sugar transferase [Chloroflexota bacterium]
MPWVRALFNPRAIQRVLFGLDVALINVAFYAAYVIRYEIGFPEPVLPEFDAVYTRDYVSFAVLLPALCILTYVIDGFYDAQRRRTWLDQTYRLISGTMTSIVLVMAITFFLQPLVYSRGMLILAGILIVMLLSAIRLVLRGIEGALRRRGLGVARVIVVGAGELGRSVMRAILADPAPVYAVVGYVDDDPAKGGGSLGRIKGLGDINALPHLLTEIDVDEVIVTLPWMYHRRIMQIAETCERGGVQVRIVPDYFQQRLYRLDVETLNGIPLVNAGGSDRLMNRTSFLAKRVTDVLLTILALPLFLLILLIVSALIKLDSPGPIFFKHRRVGKNGREIEVYKFRTMIDGADRMQSDLADLNEADGPLFKIKDDPRRTRVGKWLRKTSLDELPQIINILRGEMSWVGPRPGTPEEVAQYEPWQRKRMNVLPGITGLWQVSGRSNIPFAEMCLLDIFYIENWSLDLEIRILLRTIPSVLLGRGAY